MTAGLSPEQVARRVERDLAGAERVWIAPELTLLRELIGAARQAPEAVDVAVIEVDALDESGGIHGPRTPPRAGRTIGVSGSPVHIVDSLPSGTRTRVDRVYSPLGVVDVHADGLVIVELAPGISAIDVQRHAEPTLKISSRVTVMRDTFGPTDP